MLINCEFVIHQSKGLLACVPFIVVRLNQLASNPIQQFNFKFSNFSAIELPNDFVTSTTGEAVCENSSVKVNRLCTQAIFDRRCMWNSQHINGHSHTCKLLIVASFHEDE